MPSPEEGPTIRVTRVSNAALNDLIMIQEALLASEPDSFAFQLSLLVSLRRWEERFGMKRIPLSYVDISPDDVAQLLGQKGLTLLGKVSGLINVAAVEGRWPLEALEVRRQTDPEIEDMKHVLVVLRLRTSLDKADEILDSFYPEIDNLAGSLSYDERLVLNNGIVLDTETVVPPEPNESFGNSPQKS